MEKWSGVLSWATINKCWGDLYEYLRTHLALDEHRQVNAEGIWVEAGRPMIEDIVCCRASYDPRMLFYLRAAGLDITELSSRPPKKHRLGVAQRVPVAGGSRGQVAPKQKKKRR